MMRTTFRSNPPSAMPKCATVGLTVSSIFIHNVERLCGSSQINCRPTLPRLEESRGGDSNERKIKETAD